MRTNFASLYQMSLADSMEVWEMRSSRTLSRRHRHRRDVHRPRPHRRRDGRTVGRQDTDYPRGPVRGGREGLLGMLEREGIEAGRLGTVVHGTTLVTNALIERRGANGPAHDRGLPRRGRDRHRAPLRHVRHLHRETRAPRSAQPTLWRARAYPRRWLCGGSSTRSR